MSIEDLAATLRTLRRGRPFIVGITGAVASGKSTLAGALAPLLAASGATVEVVATDGFLLANAILDERGLTLRKGYPETYDLAALSTALRGARAGPITVPAYSHVTYDIDPTLSRSIGQPDVLIIEGLALGLERPADPNLIDCLIYIEAAETDLETWFVARFMSLWEAAADDPASFYRRFRDRDAAGAEALARMVWSGINLPNLRDHIAPVRAFADLIVEKAADHSLLRIRWG